MWAQKSERAGGDMPRREMGSSGEWERIMVLSTAYCPGGGLVVRGSVGIL